MTDKASSPPVIVDARGMRCPWPALRLARALRTARVAELISDDPRVEAEVRALAARHGWRLTLSRNGADAQIRAERA